MNDIKPAREMERLTARTSTGHRTTASMPKSVKAEYVQAFGGPTQFREKFNAAMRNKDALAQADKDGYTRSMAVRRILDRQLGR